MQSAVVKSQSAPSFTAGRKSSRTPKSAKLSAYLVTRDDGLWPQIGAHIGQQLILKQTDSIDELLATTPREHPAIILWDARHQPDAAGVLSRLQQHSACFVVVALDDADANSGWQVVVNVAIPVLPNELTAALQIATDEVRARIALLGEAGAEARAPVSGVAPDPAVKEILAAHRRSSHTRRFPWTTVLIVIGLGILCIGIYVVLQPADTVAKSASPSPLLAAKVPGASPKLPAMDDTVDVLIESAQKAMLDRHFIDPAEGSAMSLYRSVLQLDPSNGEANQGLLRIAEVLFSRVKSALDERKFDVALQALETARSINPIDARLAAFDQRIAALRAELGPAQIQAAINAQNFDRASQLIEEAARAKSLSNAKLVQLRDDLKARRQDSDVVNFTKLIDLRLQQDKVIEPREDSAAFYLGQARGAGASAVALQPQTQEIDKRLAQTVRAAIDQRRFADADRLLADLHSDGIAAATLAPLQRDLAAARVQAAGHDQPQALDLAVARLAQGELTEPDNDSALYYVNQLRASDPNNAGLARISGAVQEQILEQARAALDATQTGSAESLLRLAAGLGPSSVLDTLNQRLAQVKASAGASMPEVAESSLTRINAIETSYPTVARRKNIEGWVELSYQVTPQGSVVQIHVTNSSPIGMFDDAAAKALARVHYQPVQRNGNPSAVTTRIRIAFRLSK